MPGIHHFFEHQQMPFPQPCFDAMRTLHSCHRLDYLEKANLFADDVRKDHDLEERKKFKEELINKYQNKAEAGSDLGLW